MKELRTVEDFHSQNLQFAEGDTADYLGREISIATAKLMNVIALNVTSFAWRENKDFTAPAFKGHIEYELKNGETGTALVSLVSFEGFMTTVCVKRWRPYLAPEPEHIVLPKIKYTKEDHASGKIPPIGSLALVQGEECMVLGHDIGSEKSSVQFTRDSELAIIKTKFLTPVINEREKWHKSVRDYSGLAFEDGQLDAIYNGMLDGKIPMPKI